MDLNSLSDSQYSQPVLILWPFKTYLEREYSSVISLKHLETISFFHLWLT